MRLLIRIMLFSFLIFSIILITYICILSSIFLFQEKNMPMSEMSNYLSNSDGHFCDVNNCIIRTSLKLHTFGRRFYSCHYWSPVSTISKYWQNILCCALKNQFVVFMFMCCILLCKMMIVHASSSSG